MEEDLEKELEQLKMRVKIKRSIDKIKLSWPGDHMTAEEKDAVCESSDKYLGDGYALQVLFACTIYREDIASKPQFINKQGRGRPKGSKDYAVKKLINQLAVIYKRSKGNLPCQYLSTFGKMVNDIAHALNVRDKKGYYVTWDGHVNDVLKGNTFARIRERQELHHYHADFGDVMKDVEDESTWRDYIEKSDHIKALCVEAVMEGIIDFERTLKLEEKIKEIPESENFTITVKKK